MKRLTTAMLVSVFLIAGCGGSDDAEDPSVTGQPITATCPADDPDCADGADAGGALPLPSAVALGDPNDPDAPLLINFGGFFYSDGEVSQLCSSLAESFPPQCGSVVIDIEAPLDVALEHVAESFGNPDEAKINVDQGIYWTDNWVNLSGTLAANRLVLDE